MKPSNFKKSVSQIYLALVPILTVIFGLSVGYISYKIYLPIWLANVFFMSLSMWTLGGYVLRTNDIEKKHLVA